MTKPLSPRRLLTLIRDLEAEPPLTTAFERRLSKTTSSLREAWYRHQKEHWLGWLREYNGPGHYGRKSWDVTAETVYKRINNPAMVLYLGEAAGVPTAQVQEAIAAATKAGPSFPSQCAAIRRVIPWHEIEPLLARKPARSRNLL
jgi:hypothetical protein